MSTSAKTPFEAGYVAGLTDAKPMDDFNISMLDGDFVVGYIMGFSESDSIRAASPYVAAWTAAELGVRYNVSLKTLIADLGFDAELVAELRESYHIEAGTGTHEDE